MMMHELLDFVLGDLGLDYENVSAARKLISPP